MDSVAFSFASRDSAIAAMEAIVFPGTRLWHHSGDEHYVSVCESRATGPIDFDAVIAQYARRFPDAKRVSFMPPRPCGLVGNPYASAGPWNLGIDAGSAVPPDRLYGGLLR